MRAKRRIWLLMLPLLVIGVCAAFTYFYGEESQKEAQHVNVSAKVDLYTDANTLVSDSEIIAVCEKISEDEPVVQKDGAGNILAVYTLSIVRVKSVKKGDVSVGDELTVMENQGYDETTNTVYHIANYQAMQSNHEYLLLLRSSTSDPWYIPLAVNAGKIPMNENESILSPGTEENLELETRVLYDSVKEELL